MAEKLPSNGTSRETPSSLVCMPRLIDAWRAPLASVNYEPDQHAIVLEQLVRDPFICRNHDLLNSLNTQRGPVCFYPVRDPGVLRLRAWSACLDPRHCEDLSRLLIAHARIALRREALYRLFAG